MRRAGYYEKGRKYCLGTSLKRPLDTLKTNTLLVLYSCEVYRVRHDILSHFSRRIKFPLRCRKPQNNSLLGKVNINEVILNQKGTRIVKDGEDCDGLQMTSLKNVG